MDFNLDEPHQAVADLAADVLGRADDPWPALAKAGLLTLTLPTDLGGDGLGVLAISLVLTELGRHAHDVPITTLAALPAITDQNLLLQIADGDAPTEPLDITVPELNALATAGACAYADGLLAGALDLTVNHIRTREQFGRPLATFQAVAHQIADVYIAARTLHLATRSACWRLDTHRPADADLAVAAYWLAEELLPAMHTCHHLHGGLGLDITYPMHRYYARARELTRFVGGVDASLERLGASACSST
ncbi:MAG TPA: acyl-CoA dehydrogenase family protein [Pseudonocardiaceae bacterium]